jgi:hypothetical protein
MEVPKVMMQIDSTHENQHNYSTQSENAYGATFGFNPNRFVPKIDFPLISPEKTKKPRLLLHNQLQRKCSPSQVYHTPDTFLRKWVSG